MTEKFFERKKNSAQQQMNTDKNPPLQVDHDLCDSPSALKKVLEGFFANDDFDCIALKKLTDLRQVRRFCRDVSPGTAFYAVFGTCDTKECIYVSKTVEAVEKMSLNPFEIIIKMQKGIEKAKNNEENYFSTDLDEFFTSPFLQTLVLSRCFLPNFADVKNAIELVARRHEKVAFTTKSSAVTGAYFDFTLTKISDIHPPIEMPKTVGVFEKVANEKLI